MRQEMIIAGIVRLSGTSKKSGNTYDFMQVHVLDPIKQGGAVQQCEGFEPRQIECEPNVMMELRGGKFPAPYLCELSIGRDNKIRITSVQAVDDKKVRQAS